MYVWIGLNVSWNPNIAKQWFCAILWHFVQISPSTIFRQMFVAPLFVTSWSTFECTKLVSPVCELCVCVRHYSIWLSKYLVNGMKWPEVITWQRLRYDHCSSCELTWLHIIWIETLEHHSQNALQCDAMHTTKRLCSWQLLPNYKKMGPLATNMKWINGTNDYRAVSLAVIRLQRKVSAIFVIRAEIQLANASKIWKKKHNAYGAAYFMPGLKHCTLDKWMDG